MTDKMSLITLTLKRPVLLSRFKSFFVTKVKVMFTQEQWIFNHTKNRFHQNSLYRPGVKPQSVGSFMQEEEKGKYIYKSMLNSHRLLKYDKP